MQTNARETNTKSVKHIVPHRFHSKIIVYNFVIDMERVFNVPTTRCVLFRCRSIRITSQPMFSSAVGCVRFECVRMCEPAGALHSLCVLYSEWCTFAITIQTIICFQSERHAVLLITAYKSHESRVCVFGMCEKVPSNHTEINQLSSVHEVCSTHGLNCALERCIIMRANRS